MIFKRGFVVFSVSGTNKIFSFTCSKAKISWKILFESACLVFILLRITVIAIIIVFTRLKDHYFPSEIIVISAIIINIIIININVFIINFLVLVAVNIVVVILIMMTIITVIITRKALGERRPPPSSTVPPYNDFH